VAAWGASTSPAPAPGSFYYEHESGVAPGSAAATLAPRLAARLDPDRPDPALEAAWGASTAPAPAPDSYYYADADHEQPPSPARLKHPPKKAGGQAQRARSTKK
jgi:hypothetical protein